MYMFLQWSGTLLIVDRVTMVSCVILRPAFFFICVKIDPPDDQNQDIFSWP